MFTWKIGKAEQTKYEISIEIGLLFLIRCRKLHIVKLLNDGLAQMEIASLVDAMASGPRQKRPFRSR